MGTSPIKYLQNIFPQKPGFDNGNVAGSMDPGNFHGGHANTVSFGGVAALRPMCGDMDEAICAKANMV